MNKNSQPSDYCFILQCLFFLACIISHLYTWNLICLFLCLLRSPVLPRQTSCLITWINECQLTANILFPVRMTHDVKLLLIPSDPLIFYSTKTIYFYPLFPVFDPSIFFMQIFFFLTLCFFEVINLNFSNINTMHLMTTIQIHMFMAVANRKKCPGFCFRKQKPQEHHSLLGPNQTLQTGVLHVLTLSLIFFSLPTFIGNMKEVTGNFTNRKFKFVLTIIPTFLSWQTVQFSPIGFFTLFLPDPFLFYKLNQQLKYNTGFNYHNELRVIFCPNRY